MKADIREQDHQLNNQPGVDLKTVYRSLLKIVAQIGETAYTDSMVCQTAEVELDDPANPASEDDTRRAETHCT